jgi:hypothetical protein
MNHGATPPFNNALTTHFHLNIPISLIRREAFAEAVATLR